MGRNPAGLATIDQIGRAFGLSDTLEQAVSTACASCPQVPRRIGLHQQAPGRRDRCARRQIHEHRHPERRAGRALHERHRAGAQHDQPGRPGAVPARSGGACLDGGRPGRRPGRAQRAATRAIRPRCPARSCCRYSAPPRTPARPGRRSFSGGADQLRPPRRVGVERHRGHGFAGNEGDRLAEHGSSRRARSLSGSEPPKPRGCSPAL